MRTKTIHGEIKAGRLPQGYELRQSDIGTVLDEHEFGDVCAPDVGKRVYARSFGLEMESSEQRAERKAQEDDEADAQDAEWKRCMEGRP